MEESAWKKEAKEVYAKWVELEETHWRQVSKELWLKAGDRNTRYFHRMASAHRRVNHMDRIKINGITMTKEREIREGIVNAFKQQFSESSEWKADIGSLSFNQICVQEAERLEAPFSEGEVQTALMEMNGDKAPGPDGFLGFLLAMLLGFRQGGNSGVVQGVPRPEYVPQEYLSINNTFLVLIPKKGGAEDFGDFRPISLLGGLYKLLAKVLANRLKKVIDKVVSHDQNAFVKGRQILDASLIANEVIDNWNKKGDKGVIYKAASRRPPVPLSFVMGMEVLSVLIRRAMEGGFISGCKIQCNRGRAVHIAHLLFADDTIVFCEAKKEYLTNLSWILFWFEAASELKINLAKSEVIPVGEVQRIEELVVELGCRVGKLPSVYLGLPLGVPNKAAYGWDGIEEK
ncbi:LINE-1 retrotransposable element ORF2 protein [Vitis vinifera]|uniref:LINE-1 retrotransposable element ORF2 protein n=1 Tax=Vitis vinifera TaxID=29760 RepID=A0A438HZG2_VITVI|nr:LINE-1 retrotransposable element ORF2 protein [Vitis vinifera]